uniref:Uncharacterized protein n=1 Tax=Strongyloides venezuelensis TaxID=75913 RepID=A0A0K0F5D1_STRVS
MILLNNFRIRKLEIEFIDPRYIAHLRRLNCFEFVESVTLGINNSLLVGKSIFDYWKNLSSRTIKVHSSSSSSILHPSVKNIQFYCACNKISWLFNLTDYFLKRRFDTLEFGNKFLSGIDSVWNFGDKLVKLIKRFKHVKIVLKDELSHGITGYFFKNMIFIWQIKDTEIEFDVKSSLKKLEDDQNRLFIPEREQTPEGFAEEIFKLIFLKMKCLSVMCERNCTKPSIRFRGLFAKLVDKMTNLEALEVSMKIFSGLKEVLFFVNRLSIGINNLKFVNCGR